MSGLEHLPVRAELARKSLHAATAVLPIGLACGWTDQPTLRVALAVAAGVALVIEAARALVPAVGRAFCVAFGSLLRTHERGGITGATWLAVAMALVVWLAPLHVAVVALWAAAVGDAAAAVIGSSAKRRQAPPRAGKTLVGSGAALAATTLGALWLTPASVVTALTLGAVAALAERPAVAIDDNLRIALAVALAATLLGLR